LRAKALDAIHRTVKATGAASGEQAERLARIEKMFDGDAPRKKAAPAARKATRSASK